jgi:hypothetical protein
VSLFFEKKTRFEVGVGDNIIATDYANAGQVVKITVSSAHQNCHNLTRSFTPGINWVYFYPGTVTT